MAILISISSIFAAGFTCGNFARDRKSKKGFNREGRLRSLFSQVTNPSRVDRRALAPVRGCMELNTGMVWHRPRSTRTCTTSIGEYVLPLHSFKSDR
jgi:hypothetical protein